MVYRQLAISLPKVNFIFMNLLEQTTFNLRENRMLSQLWRRIRFLNFDLFILFQAHPAAALYLFHSGMFS